jgi:hypothetical protein
MRRWQRLELVSKMRREKYSLLSRVGHTQKLVNLSFRIFLGRCGFIRHFVDVV